MGWSSEPATAALTAAPFSLQPIRFSRWLTDPFKFFDQHGTKFARAIMDISDSFGNNPHSVGREPQTYRQISSEFRRWYLENLELDRKVV
jgi:hypothetical protein